MKAISCFVIGVIAVILLSLLASSLMAESSIRNRLLELEKGGNFSEAERLIAAHLRQFGQKLSAEEQQTLAFEAERLRRIRIDYSLSREQLFEQLAQSIPDLKPEDLDRWEGDGTLDVRVIDGTKRYYRRAIANLFRLSTEAQQRRSEEPSQSKERSAARERLVQHVTHVIQEGKKATQPYLLPQEYRVRMTLSVPAGEVPAGTLLRCWLPFPRPCETVKEVKLISAHPEQYTLAPTDFPERTIYFEQKAQGDQPTTFGLEYQFTTRAAYFVVEPDKVKPYDTSSKLFKEYTREQPPHIVFSPELRTLAAEIVGSETNPYLKARKIFLWCCENVRYVSAYEYSTYPNISDYVYRKRQGDCGMQVLLFMTLCRIAGIPARWESGWYVQPGRYNMHDWAQFYLEPFGWLYADPSKGLFTSPDEDVKYFYFGNIDHFRMVCNHDICTILHPAKKHFRSDTVDNQRGEVETPTKNLYYPQWDYDFELLSPKP